MKHDGTIAYYDNKENEYVKQTVDADMSSAYERFQECLPEKASILDAGCGSGRDSLHFIKAGYRVTAMDASELMCKSAEGLIGQPVFHMSFDEIDFDSCFDGAWACASLLHVGEKDLPEVMNRIVQSLKPGGVLYASWKYGSGERFEEGSGRFFCDMDEYGIRRLIDRIPGASICDQWISEDGRRATRAVRWINVILVRIVNP